MDIRSLELLQQLMNKAPGTDPFALTFDPATDSLEAISDAITGLESGIFTYAAKFGPSIVELDNKANFGTELLNPGGAVILEAEITEGLVKVDRIRDGTLTNIVSSTDASKADGIVFYEYQFLTANWSPGDLFLLTFTGASVTIGTVTTALPDAHFYGRFTRDELLYDPDSGLVALHGDLGDKGEGADAITRLGAFDGGADPQGDIFAALGVSDSNSITNILGIDPDDGTLAVWDTDHWEGTALARLQKLILTLTNGTGSVIGEDLSIIDLFGAFDGGADPQGDIYQALGVSATHSITDVLGIDPDSATLATWDTDHWEGTALARLQKALDIITKGTGTSIGADLSLIDLIGAFDGGADPQGDIFQALGNPATNSIWSGVQYIEDVACPAAPVAGSLLQVIVEDIYERTNNKTLNALLGVVDGAGYSINGNIGNFQAQVNLQTLLEALGIPDVAGKDLYTCTITDRLGTITDAAAEAGTLLPRVRFYGEGIIDGTGTVIPDNTSLYDAIGLVLARANNASLYDMLGVPDIAAFTLWDNIGNFQARVNDPSILEVLGFPDAVNGSFYERFGLFTAAENLKAILGDLSTGKRLGQILGAFDETDTLCAVIGAYDSTDSLKDHVDLISVTPTPAGGLVPKTLQAYIQAIGSNDADNDFSSAAVVADPDGSVLERLEDIHETIGDKVTDSSHNVEIADGVGEVSIGTFTPARVGKSGVQFDFATLIAAAEGGVVTVRLKHMIDNATRRTVDKQTFAIGVDEVNPTVEGWLDSANADGAEITIQCTIAVTATRNIPYKIVEAA